MENIITADFIMKLVNTSIATFFSVALLYIFFKSIPVLSQIKMIMIEVKEVFHELSTTLNEVKDVLDEVKTLLNEIKYTKR